MPGIVFFFSGVLAVQPDVPFVERQAESRIFAFELSGQGRFSAAWKANHQVQSHANINASFFQYWCFHRATAPHGCACRNTFLSSLHCFTVASGYAFQRGAAANRAAGPSSIRSRRERDSGQRGAAERQAARASGVRSSPRSSAAVRRRRSAMRAATRSGRSDCAPSERA
jgi:hypothetical protein